MDERIKKIIKSKVALAPMAGITDYVLRSLIRKYSTNCLLTTEMISSEFLKQVPDSVISKIDDNHHPIAFQISGHKPDLMNNAARLLSEKADIIDINMGCPVNKVVKGQDGASLMRNIPLASDIVKAVREGTTCPVSVKFRLGYTSDEMNYVKYGQAMQEAGAEFITLHARTRSQLYSGHADWAKIAELKKNVNIPVFANGDIKSIEDAIKCMELSQADGITIGRGCLGDPTLLNRIEQYFETGKMLPTPTLPEKIKMLKWHLNEEIKLRGEQVGIKFMRKFYPYYLAGFEHAKQLRMKIITEENYSKIVSALNQCM
ncbi:MAG: tRNA dihydrouridine synthase DusB [Clostridiaceae bacterium]|jgi:tRNA-dihydrouridine synthase B|nr:tRNA dihydrouridine synthase DusB [Clostridiaceae bacterium]